MVTSREAFRDWAGTATPSEAAGAREGVLGSLGEQPNFRKFVIPTRALRKAPGLLRDAGGAEGPLAQLLRAAGVGQVERPLSLLP